MKKLAPTTGRRVRAEVGETGFENSYVPDAQVHRPPLRPEPKDAAAPAAPEAAAAEVKTSPAVDVKPVDDTLSAPLAFVVSTEAAIEKVEKLLDMVQQSRPDLKTEVENILTQIERLENPVAGDNGAASAAGGGAPADAGATLSPGDSVEVEVEGATYPGVLVDQNADGTWEVDTDQNMKLSDVPATSIRPAQGASPAGMSLPAALALKPEPAKVSAGLAAMQVLLTAFVEGKTVEEALAGKTPEEIENLVSGWEKRLEEVGDIIESPEFLQNAIGQAKALLHKEGSMKTPVAAAKLKADFMEKQIHGPIAGVDVTYKGGESFHMPWDADEKKNFGEPSAENVAKMIGEEPGEIQSVEVVHGYFGRYSAPGYLDATDWVFDEDEKACEEELERIYGLDNDDDESTVEAKIKAANARIAASPPTNPFETYSLASWTQLPEDIRAALSAVASASALPVKPEDAEKWWNTSVDSARREFLKSAGVTEGEVIDAMKASPPNPSTLSEGDAGVGSRPRTFKDEVIKELAAVADLGSAPAARAAAAVRDGKFDKDLQEYEASGSSVRDAADLVTDMINVATPTAGGSDAVEAAQTVKAGDFHCAECNKWTTNANITVSGLPGKKFCSDACAAAAQKKMNPGERKAGRAESDRAMMNSGARRAADGQQVRAGADLYELFKAAGLKTDSHESDLYVEDTPEARAILEKNGKKVDGHNVQQFVDQVTKAPWLDIPFAYTPFWEKKNSQAPEAGAAPALGKDAFEAALAAVVAKPVETAVKTPVLASAFDEIKELELGGGWILRRKKGSEKKAEPAKPDAEPKPESAATPKKIEPEMKKAFSDKLGAVLQKKEKGVVADYQGWRNYATWGVALIIDNDQALLEQALEIAGQHKGVDLDRAFQDFVEELASEVEPTTMAGQLIQGALAEVDWKAVSDHYTETLKEQSPTPEAPAEAGAVEASLVAASKQASPEIKEKLEKLRKEIENETISTGEIAELQSLVEYIEPGDVQLLEWAGVKEFPGDVEASLKAGADKDPKADAKDAKFDGPMIEVVNPDGKVEDTLPDAFGTDTVAIIKLFQKLYDTSKKGEAKDDKADKPKADKDKDKDKAAESKDDKPAPKKDDDLANKPQALPKTAFAKVSKDDEKELEAVQRMFEDRIVAVRAMVAELVKKNHVVADQKDVDDILMAQPDGKQSLEAAMDAALSRAADRKFQEILAMPDAKVLMLKASLPNLQARATQVRIQASLEGLDMVDSLRVHAQKIADSQGYSLGDAFAGGGRYR